MAIRRIRQLRRRLRYVGIGVADQGPVVVFPKVVEPDVIGQDVVIAIAPAIIVDDTDGTVLMLAYMNEESLRRTMETGYTWFWSRSRQELWNKGATSGHTQKVVSITADCDDDTLLIRVHQTGPACHTGSRSCFFKPLWQAEDERKDG